MKELLVNYWWAIAIPYFIFGFAAFYVSEYRSKMRGEVPSNGVIGNFFVAVMWGVFWIIYPIVVGCAWLSRVVESKTGVYFNPIALAIALVCIYSTIEASVRIYKNHGQGLGEGVFMVIVTFLAMSLTFSRPQIPDFVDKKINEDLSKRDKTPKL